jgi:hypothetical protein
MIRPIVFCSFSDLKLEFSASSFFSIFLIVKGDVVAEVAASIV